jgi:non-canonical (house-cleaning) NTP pyrophosphatase
MELGAADDKVFGRVDSKRESGSVGLLSGGLIDRASYYEHAMILALVPFMDCNKGLY